jgi:hypothetical protein
MEKLFGMTRMRMVGVDWQTNLPTKPLFISEFNRDDDELL